MKLFTIGDSISQGFMSLAAARTDLCYSTILARGLGLTPGKDYLFPEWGAGGLPLNLEALLRHLQRYYGSDISGPFEWAGAVWKIMKFMDDVEDHYERGVGRESAVTPVWGSAATPECFHNIAFRGMDVADAWLMSDIEALHHIDGTPSNNHFGLPDHHFDRTAAKVLNPQRLAHFRGYTPLDWLRHHAAGEGVENLILSVGANNALGTIVDMQIAKTPGDLIDISGMSQQKRREYNLHRPRHFQQDYTHLIEGVLQAMETNTIAHWKVFVGTVPAITIAPLAKGVGEVMTLDDPFGELPSANYFEYYTYVPFDLKTARTKPNLRLELAEALEIDRYIAQYNDTIKNQVVQANAAAGAGPGGSKRFHLVDINTAFLKMAYKRNGGHPTYPYPAKLKAALGNRVPDPRYHNVTTNGTLSEGGLISLDGVHPSAIGQGLLAHEFRLVMEAAGVAFSHPMDWPAIVATDDLWLKPLKIIREIYDNTRLADTLLSFFRSLSKD